MTCKVCVPHFFLVLLCLNLALYQVQFYPYLSRQFSIALDVYLQILANVDSLVHQAISRSDPIWRLKHACPACTYTLKGEVPLKFSLLYTMDGNDSLKRVLKKLDSDDDNDDAPPRSAELPSTQVVRGDRYLSREYVDQFLADSPTDMMADEDEVSLSSCLLCLLTWFLGQSLCGTMEKYEGREDEEDVGCI